MYSIPASLSFDEYISSIRYIFFQRRILDLKLHSFVWTTATILLQNMKCILLQIMKCVYQRSNTPVKAQLICMFEANTISLKENNVLLLSKKNTLSCIWQVAPFFLKSHCPFLRKCIWRKGLTHQKENCFSCPSCLKVTPIYTKILNRIW